MARRLIVISKCPLCREDVEQVSDGVLNRIQAIYSYVLLEYHD